MKSSKAHDEIYILFENDHAEGYFEDGSILAWQHDQLVYISNQGHKASVSIQTAPKNPELRKKMKNLLSFVNEYTTEHKFYQLDAEVGQTVQRTIEIKDFEWRQVEVEETKDRFCVRSDDGGACVALYKDLYRVEVEYLQLLGQLTLGDNNPRNYIKQLLEKYEEKYVQIPAVTKEPSLATYKYTKQRKSFTIFSMGSEWKEPLNLIWSSLLAHQIIPHSFLHFHQPLSSYRPTPMPPISKLLSPTSSTCALGIPILNNPNHHDLCRCIRKKGKGREPSCSIWFRQQACLWDGWGFWFLDGSTVSYQTHNNQHWKQKYYTGAIPYVSRLQNEQERELRPSLQMLCAYTQYNTKNRGKIQAQKAPFDNETNLIHEQNIDGVGNFRAYSNGTVVGKFVDKCMLTLSSKKMSIKIIDAHGEAVHVSLHQPNTPSYLNYKQYIRWVMDQQERLFFPSEWQQKQELSNQLSFMIDTTDNFSKLCSLYK